MRALVAFFAALAAWLELGAVCDAVSCTISATAPVFGSYAPLAGASVTASGTVSVTCSVGGTVTIKLSAGNGTYAARTLLGPAGAILNYNLYTDANHTTIFGDGTAGTATIGGTVRSGQTGTGTIYGNIPGGQDVKVGTYSSMIVATVTF